MGSYKRLIAALVIAGALAAASGCGDDDDPAQTTQPQVAEFQESFQGEGAGTDIEASGSAEDKRGRSDRESSGEALPADPERRRELGIRGGSDNSLQTFGSEAVGEERTDAERAMRGYFEAVAERDFARACGWFGRRLRQSNQELINAFREKAGLPSLTTCAELGSPLRELTEDSLLVSDARKVPQAEVLRVGLQPETGRTIVILRLAGGRLMFFPMIREEDRWRVWAMGPSPVRKQAYTPPGG